MARLRPSTRRAAVAVEFAVVITFLGVVTVGMIELGRAVMVKSVLTDAARKGAATGVTANKTYTDVWNDVDDILSKDHQLPATLSNGKATLVVSVATWNATSQTYGSDVVVGSTTFAPQQYDKVSVKVSVKAADVTWMYLNYTAGDLESETVVMMHQ